MRQKQGWLTAVTLLLLLLAACGGAVDEAQESVNTDMEAGEAVEGVEATGSEGSGVILPTPIQGAKVPPAPSTPGAAANSPILDVLLVAETPLTHTLDLAAVANWANVHGFDLQIGVVLYGEREPVGVYPFTADRAMLTAVLSGPATPLDAPITLTTALEQATAQAGWRPDGTNRFIFSLLNTAVPAEEASLWQQAAQESDSQLIHLAPLIGDETDVTQILLAMLVDSLTNYRAENRKLNNRL